MVNKELFNNKLLRSMLEKSEFDAIVTASPYNIHFTSGANVAHTVRDPSGEYRLFFSVIPRDGDPTLIVVCWEKEHARATSWIKDVRPYVEFKEPPLNILANVLKEKGLEKSKIGIEKSYIISSYWEKILQLMPDAEFQECTNIFARARRIKTPEAIKLLRNAAYKTDKAIATAFATAKVGDTELSLSRQMGENVIKLGAEGVCHNTLASGKDSYIVHLTARDKKISVGDVVHIDFGGVFSAYHTDVSRAGVCAKASSKQQARWTALWRAQRNAIRETMHVGKRTCDVYNGLRREFKKNNIPLEAYHGPGHVGHSIGLETHEPPLLHPYNKETFEANTVWCVEPTVLEPGWARYHLEDMVLITEDGPEILSNYTTSEELLVIEA